MWCRRSQPITKVVKWEVSIDQPGTYNDTDTDTSEATRQLGKYEVPTEDCIFNYRNRLRDGCQRCSGITGVHTGAHYVAT